MTSRTSESEQARALLSASAVREAARRTLEFATHDARSLWRVDLDRLPIVADAVAALTRERFPKLDVPMHARWRHFVFNGRDLWQEVATARWPDPIRKARAAVDLVVPSVLLDAGAGPTWKYTDAATGIVATRSEGLALASLRWFEAGALRGPESLLRIDAHALNEAFQVSDANPLVGAESRAALMNRLGQALQVHGDGGLFNVLVTRKPLRAARILEVLLETLGPIWSGRPSLDGVSLGDCWPHPTLGYVPFHKLSQWLAYSLIEPLEAAGVRIEGLDELTGLPEYRNGGLFVDTGVLAPVNRSMLAETHAVASPFVIELRSLTIALLDLLAPLVGARLGLPNDQYRLARVLEGGTWTAGRRIAREKRPDGGPPFHISSDGTVL